jgi:beta-lactam-binding protein with PASTA domain
MPGRAIKKFRALGFRGSISALKVFVSENRKIFILLFVYFTLFLVVSSIIMMIRTKPESEVKIPDVIGKKFTTVYGMLSRKSLKPEVSFYDAFEVEDGVILKQYPEPGAVVSEGDVISLTVSRNNLVIDAPSLVGKELPVAKNMLHNLHLGDRTMSIGVGVVSYIPSDKSAENIVLDQSPKPGEKITPEQKINILVSAGAVGPDMKMPDLSSQSIDLCYDLLSAKGVIIQQEVVIAATSQETGKIVSQDPTRDAPIVSGQVVKLKVGYYPKEEHYYYGYEKINYLIPEDEKEGLYEVYVDDYNPKRVVFTQRLKPKQAIQFVFHRTGNARVSILRDKKPVKVMSIEVEDF